MTLEEVRAKIDEIDRDLVRLLNARAECVNIVGEIKHREGLEIYAPEREEKLLRRLAELNAAMQGRLPERSIRAIYREIMSAALALEQPLTIAYLGQSGSLAHQAALSKFGHGVTYASSAEAPRAIDLIQTKQADYAVLPMEHMVDGVVQHTLDYIADSSLQICAQMLMAGGANGQQRLLILGRSAAKATDDDRTMLLVDVTDAIGALKHLLEPIEKHGLNVCHIEHRPRPAGTPARFFIELSAHSEAESLSAAITALTSDGHRVKVLGCYPACAWVEREG
jgi:chorismate mutase-like protein